MIVCQPDVDEGPKLLVNIGEPTMISWALHGRCMAHDETVGGWRRELLAE